MYIESYFYNNKCEKGTRMTELITNAQGHNYICSRFVFKWVLDVSCHTFINTVTNLFFNMQWTVMYEYLTAICLSFIWFESMNHHKQPQIQSFKMQM